MCPQIHSVDAVRFEVPSSYRHVRRLRLRYARWDLSVVDLIDTRSASQHRAQVWRRCYVA
jgi:hypothetical protein